MLLTLPVAINGMLKLEEIRVIEGIKQPVNTLAQIRGEYFVASKYDFWKLDSNLKPVVHAQMDPWYSANVLDIVSITPFKEDAFVLMGSNKSLLRARWNPNADDVKGWANFMVGGDKVEHVGGLGRARIAPTRQVQLRAFVCNRRQVRLPCHGTRQQEQVEVCGFQGHDG